jgi:hypothetical protein
VCNIDKRWQVTRYVSLDRVGLDLQRWNTLDNKTFPTLLSTEYIAKRLISTVSVCEMLRQGICVSRSLVAEGQRAVSPNVSARVLKRCNSTVAATQAKPEEWNYAKPFEDIPGPKPLPLIGNVWRFLPFLGKLLFPYVIRLCSQSRRIFVRSYVQFTCYRFKIILTLRTFEVLI